ncbi:MAG: hypothetical protein PF904_12350 [Kiritimatiellae bacterium]|nr:hypothetical protein [Kiritimatiellia bacterium]
MRAKHGRAKLLLSRGVAPLAGRRRTEPQLSWVYGMGGSMPDIDFRNPAEEDWSCGCGA